jgi:nucleoside-diphosphate-sugar epimerase
MNLLVTGASGFVGRRLLEWLAAHGHTGTATGREPPPHVPAGWRSARRSDVLAGAAIPQPDVIVHLEVKQHVARPTPADIRAFHRSNVGGTADWLDWAGRRGVGRFVFVSSIKAGAEGPGRSGRADTPYGRSKAKAERVVRRWVAAAPGRAAVILRPAPVYGPGNEANLAAFVRQILAGRPAVVGAGAARKSIVSRTNLAAAIEFAARRLVAATPEDACAVYAVSDPETLSVGRLAALIAELAGAPAPRRIPNFVAEGLAPLGDVVSWATGREFPLTTARLRALREESDFPCAALVAAGYVHPQTTRDGLLEMIEWFRSRG